MLILYSAVFQAGGMVVILVEVIRKAYLASIVPVIVNAVLNEHQLVVDIVAFVSKGDFPRSRLGDKQRGKILGSWVTRKMRTIAQFGIRDTDSADSQITEVAEPVSRMTSVQDGMHGPSSLRHAESLSDVPPGPPPVEYAALPTGISEMPGANISEMPAHYNDSILESTGEGMSIRSDETPTEPHSNHFELEDNAVEGSPPPINRSSKPLDPSFSFELYSPDGPLDNENLTPEPLRPEKSPPRQNLPSVTGRESLIEGDLRLLPSQQQLQGGLRIANATADEEEEEEDWPEEAIMHMNLAGIDTSRPQHSPPLPSAAEGYGHAL